ncbi:BZ3500_MvSof-1268-A1-R1_Chr1-3g02213 [Microbotryum saponariae]|uniref:BZ3500_MvSof-1268-A1-R1_Chr1-3g02213 protein n=1 Tax=Microbotryum saponariae TaxID=289078 RepID=A0A2X0M9J6_9BASI|nr:BZ3500_MvSof-1268-A1-R1_Chr1-3g02213 [Microbotryum saponariae]SCZ95662.1 BZ3501_MvSof-1269-A2-R1_Chr1-3g01816 [Microbotryum saponariae]
MTIWGALSRGGTGWGGHWCTQPVPTSNRAKKQKSCLNSPARGSSFGWVN